MKTDEERAKQGKDRSYRSIVWLLTMANKRSLNFFEMLVSVILVFYFLYAT